MYRYSQLGQVVMLAALKTADGSAVGIANHAAAMLKAPMYATICQLRPQRAIFA
jgi:hypothetical protein